MKYIIFSRFYSTTDKEFQGLCHFILVPSANSLISLILVLLYNLPRGGGFILEWCLEWQGWEGEYIFSTCQIKYGLQWPWEEGTLAILKLYFDYL